MNFGSRKTAFAN